LQSTPLSFNQAYFVVVGWWLHMQGHEIRQPNTHQLITELTGPLDYSELRAGIADIVCRHDVLRAAVLASNFNHLRVSLHMRGIVSRRLSDGIVPGALLREGLLSPDSELLGPDVFEQVVSVQSTTTAVAESLHLIASDATEDDIPGLAANQIADSWDYSQTPRFRVSLLRLEERRHILMVAFDFLSSDGVSLRVFLRELAEYYGRRVGLIFSPLPPLSMQYAEYALWERDRLQGPRLKVLLDFWKTQWSQVPNPDSVLSMIRPPRHAPDKSMPAPRRAVIDETLTMELRCFARRQHITISMLWLALLAIVLRKYSTTDVIPIMGVMPNRGRPGTENLIGRFSNVHVMMLRFNNAYTMGDFLKHVKTTVLATTSHQDLPSFAATVWNGIDFRPVTTTFRFSRRQREALVQGPVQFRVIDLPRRDGHCPLEVHVADQGQTMSVSADAAPQYSSRLVLGNLVSEILSSLRRTLTPGAVDRRLEQIV
jgi:hypothetical protein